jgi:transcriptional regulator with XRE-family HTH domain
MIVGQKIKKLRELKNFTQEFMAKELNLSQSAYSKIESGETDIPYSRLEEVAQVLGMRPEDVVAFNEHMVFNVMHNQTGNGLVIQNQLAPGEKKLYEEQIELLKKEIEYLKSVLDKVLNDK